MKKEAFTLAEILIAIKILGVIAALTIRTVIIRAQERETVVKVTRMYSRLDNAFDTYKVLSGNNITGSVNLNSNDRRVTDIYRNFIQPNFRIVRDCGTTGRGCFPVDGGWRKNFACKTLDGRNLSENKLAPCTASNWLWNWEGTYYRVLTADNIGIAVYSIRAFQWDVIGDGQENLGWVNGAPVVGVIAIDLNGPKNPNTLGRDICVVGITKEGGWD